jgi:hypothetical protein
MQTLISQPCERFSAIWGFVERIRGSHHIFTREGVAEILNLQPRGSKAKAYQVKQVRNVIVANRLAGEEASSEVTEANETNQADADKKEEGDAGKDSVWNHSVLERRRPGVYC